MLIVERVVDVLATHSVVEVDVDVRGKDSWVVQLGYRHI